MLYSFVGARYCDGSRTGVPRFDSSLSLIFPDIVSVSRLPEKLTSRDTVITDNHLSQQVPSDVPTVVVHHGCAAVHWLRDPKWRTEYTQRLVGLQGGMFSRSSRVYVAPSRWVAEAFAESYHLNGNYHPTIIPHYVGEIAHYGPRRGKPVIIGDWRDWNKGATVWQKIAAVCPEFEFRPLNFRDEKGRLETYAFASAYLCLSVSEGGPYSVCDAEATGLPLVTTDVGNCREFTRAVVIPWQKREDAALVKKALHQALSAPRQPNFYETYSRIDWANAWKRVVKEARKPQPPVIS